MTNAAPVGKPPADRMQFRGHPGEVAASVVSQAATQFRGTEPHAVDEGVEADVQVSRRPGRWAALGRASIAVGLGIAGLVLVGVAVGRRGLPTQPLLVRRMGPARRRRLSARLSPPPNGPRHGRTTPTFGTRSRGWCCRSLIQWRCRFRGSGRNRVWWSLGSTVTARWRCRRILRALAGTPRGARARRTGASGHRRSREVERRSWGLSSPGRRQAR